jgi:hypothetical protein
MATPIQKTDTSWEFIVLRDTNNDILIMQWTTVPTDATTWYAKWAIFIDTDVATWLDWIYKNVWTNTSCIFTNVSEPIMANATVSAQPSTATINNSIAGKVVTNTWASGAITLTLPTASTMTGKYFTVTVLVAQIVNLSPIATDWVFLNGSWVDNKDLILAGTIWTSATIYSNWSDYLVTSHTSWVTKEA